MSDVMPAGPYSPASKPEIEPLREVAAVARLHAVNAELETPSKTWWWKFAAVVVSIAVWAFLGRAVLG